MSHFATSICAKKYDNEHPFCTKVGVKRKALIHLMLLYYSFAQTHR